MARVSGLVIGSIAVYAAATADSTLFRAFMSYAALEGALGVVTGEYFPITDRILHGLRIIR